MLLLLPLPVPRTGQDFSVVGRVPPSGGPARARAAHVLILWPTLRSRSRQNSSFSHDSSLSCPGSGSGLVLSCLASLHQLCRLCGLSPILSIILMGVHVCVVCDAQGSPVLVGYIYITAGVSCFGPLEVCVVWDLLVRAEVLPCTQKTFFFLCVSCLEEGEGRSTLLRHRKRRRFSLPLIDNWIELELE